MCQEGPSVGIMATSLSFQSDGSHVPTSLNPLPPVLRGSRALAVRLGRTRQRGTYQMPRMAPLDGPSPVILTASCASAAFGGSDLRRKKSAGRHGQHLSQELNLGQMDVPRPLSSGCNVPFSLPQVSLQDYSPDIARCLGESGDCV